MSKQVLATERYTAYSLPHKHALWIKTNHFILCVFIGYLFTIHISCEKHFWDLLLNIWLAGEHLHIFFQSQVGYSFSKWRLDFIKQQTKWSYGRKCTSDPILPLLKRPTWNRQGVKMGYGSVQLVSAISLKSGGSQWMNVWALGVRVKLG